jgi:hypothetical protein
MRRDKADRPLRSIDQGRLSHRTPTVIPTRASRFALLRLAADTPKAPLRGVYSQPGLRSSGTGRD